MTDNTPKADAVMSGDEVSNVDLQFVRTTGEGSTPEAERDAAMDAETHEAGKFHSDGLEKQDVAVAQTMDASDPPSTNMGDQDA